MLFGKRLNAASKPKEIESTFRAVAQSWINANKPKPENILDWTGDGWKKIVQKRFDEEISALNTPDDKNIRHLYLRYLGVDITKYWRWPHVSPTEACKKLNAVIRLRGRLVHRSKEFFDQKDSLRKKDIVDARILIDRLALATEKHFGIEPKTDNV